MESMTGSKAKSMLPTCCVPNKMPPMHMKVTDRAMEIICIEPCQLDADDRSSSSACCSALVDSIDYLACDTNTQS